MAKIVEVPGVGNVEFPDSMSDADISAALRKQPPAATSQTWAQKLGVTNPVGVPLLDLAEGAASGVASSVFHGGDVIRRIYGQPRVINEPDVQQAMREPSSFAGKAGKFGEQVLETVIPGMGLTKGLRGASLLTRIGAEAALGGTQAALQSGGDPLAIGAALALGGAGGYLGGRLAAAKPVIAETKALDALTALGVPIPTGVRSGSPFVRAIEKASGYSPLGALVVKQAERRTSTALSKGAEKLLEQAHITPVGAEEAGAGVRQALTQSAETSGSLADQAYDVFRQAEANPQNLRTVQVGTETVSTVDATGKEIMVKRPIMEDIPLPVDIRSIQKAAKPIYEHMQQWWAPADRNASAGFQALKSIITAPDHVPASVAEEGLSGLKQLAREASGRNAGLAKLLIPQVQEAIDQAVATAGPDVLDAIQAGRKATAQKFTTQGVLKKLREEPVQAFGQMTWGNDANINLLRRVSTEAPQELPKVGRAYLDKVLGKATEEGEFGLKRAAGMFRDWQNLGPETKKLMFKSPKLVEDLDNFFLGMKKLGENPNPSGSALVGMAAGQPALILANPVGGTAYILSMGALAKMLYAPGFARTLTQAMETPLAQQVRAGGLFRHLVRSIPTQALMPATQSSLSPSEAR